MAMLDTAISGITETQWTIFHLNCCKANISLERGWTAQLQWYTNYFIAELPTRAFIPMQPCQWKLFRKIFIFLNITTVADIVTACGYYITKEAYTGVKSYESNHKWPLQEHFISKAHRKLWTTCMTIITWQGSRHLHIPLGAWITSPTTIRPHRMTGDILFTPQQDDSWLQRSWCLHQQQPRSTQIQFEEEEGQHTELPSEHRIVDVQRQGTILVIEHNNLPEVEPPQNINEAAQIIRPQIQQYRYTTFEAFVQANMHLVVVDDQMQQHTFQWILTDFPPEREGFDELIQWLWEGKNIDTTSDGSRVDDGRASAGWIIWAMSNDVDEEGQLTMRLKILFGSTIWADRRPDANTAVRAEALGCLVIPIIICLANEFVHQTRRLRVRHTCDNQGLVDQQCWLYKQERFHTIPDTADNDITIPTVHWAKTNDSRMIQQQGYAERQEKDPNK